CQGIIKFKKRVGDSRLINACKRADSFNVYNYGIIERILLSKADQIPMDEQDEQQGKQNNMPDHENIRGQDYYQ
ncbi:MAG: IS21 family transposase, partial [Bacteroidota bacterium]